MSQDVEEARKLLDKALRDYTRAEAHSRRIQHR